MSGDLISRQAALDIMPKAKADRDYRTNNLDDAYEQGWDDLQKCIESLPSAERHGRWISQEYMSEIDSFIYTEYKCSNCGERTKKKSNFCPNCGAKMDEVNGISCDECEVAKYHNLEDDDSPCLNCEVE